MMWGPGGWGSPMWGFWWIFPVIGLGVCLVLMLVMIRAMSSGRGFMCMGGGHAHGPDETASCVGKYANCVRS